MFAQRWTFLEPIQTSWMNAGDLQALLNSATFVHPVRVDEDKVEPLYVEFGVDTGEGEHVLLQERDATLVEACRGFNPLTSCSKNARVKSLVDRIGANCRWQAGTYDVSLRVLYDASGEFVRRFEFELSDAEEIRARKNAEGIMTCRLPGTLPGSRSVIQPVSVAVKAV